MSEEEKRTIKINTSLFKIPDTRKNRKPKQQKEIKIKTPKKENNKTLKRSLLRFLRNHQERNLNQIKPTNKTEIDKPKTDITTEFNSDFNESLEYLTKLAKENEKTSVINPHNKTLKHYTDYGKPSIAEPIIKTTLPIELIQNDFTNKITETIQSNNPVLINYNHYPPPSYGCLKNGSLPTFRTWKNQTQKNTNNSTLNYMPIISPPAENTIKPNIVNAPTMYTNNITNTNPIQSPNNMNNMIEKSIITQNINKMTNINKNNQKKFVKKQKKTLKRTYNVGKSKMYPKISVLVSNKTIRNNITTKSQLLKQVSIQEVKKYLIKKGFIRVGSIAPNDVLRKMYETAILMCGEIQNHNPDNLLYNYLHNSEE
jgi:hypothetical protein